jgi:hypothetical protein
MERGEYKIKPLSWDGENQYYHANLHELINEVGYSYTYYITTHLVVESETITKPIIFDRAKKYYPNEVEILNK